MHSTAPHFIIVRSFAGIAPPAGRWGGLDGQGFNFCDVPGGSFVPGLYYFLRLLGGGSCQDAALDFYCFISLVVYSSFFAGHLVGLHFNLRFVCSFTVPI